jgi:hypothetical protein
METMSISRNIAARTSVTEAFVVEEWHFLLLDLAALISGERKSKMQV